jgi:hypothetical protein
MFWDDCCTQGREQADRQLLDAGAELISREAGKAEVYGDSAYGTGDLRAALGRAGHTAVIKPRPLKPAVEGRFTLWGSTTRSRR